MNECLLSVIVLHVVRAQLLKFWSKVVLEYGMYQSSKRPVACSGVSSLLLQTSWLVGQLVGRSVGRSVGPPPCQTPADGLLPF